MLRCHCKPAVSVQSVLLVRYKLINFSFCGIACNLGVQTQLMQNLDRSQKCAMFDLIIDRCSQTLNAHDVIRRLTVSLKRRAWTRGQAWNQLNHNRAQFVGYHPTWVLLRLTSHS